MVSLGEDAGREKPLRANDRFFVEHAQNYITSLPVISRNLRQKIMSVTPVSSPKRDSKQNCKIVISSPRTPTKIQCRPAGKYCVVCKLNFKPNDTFYSLSRSGILTTLNTILETNILPAIDKYDPRRLCKSCFRRSEVINNKKKVLKQLEAEFRSRYTSGLVKNATINATSVKRLSKDSPQNRYSKKIRPLHESNQDVIKRSIRTALFVSRSTDSEYELPLVPEDHETDTENIPVNAVNVPQSSGPQMNVNKANGEIKVSLYNT